MRAKGEKSTAEGLAIIATMSETAQDVKEENSPCEPRDEPSIADKKAREADTQSLYIRVLIKCQSENLLW